MGLLWGALLLLLLNYFLVSNFVLMDCRHRETWIVPSMVWYIISLLTALCGWALLKCWLSDPGYVPTVITVENGERFCEVCRSVKPFRAHHCRRCKRCVFRMDHHCTWINNCVGYTNQKYFILLLSYLVALGSVGSISTIYIWLFSIRSETFPSLVNFVVVCMNAGAAVYARLYLREQLESIETNTTLVETYQGTHGDGNVNVFEQIFGTSRYLWFFPICTTLAPNYQEQVFGSDKLGPLDAASLGISVDHVREVDKVD